VPNEKENQIMFDRLIVSAKEKSKGRTKKFFLMTTFIYSFVVASALAVSVFAASPALFEREEIIHLTPVLPQLAPPPKGSPAPQPASRQTAQPNPYKVATLEQITHPESNPNLIRAGINIPKAATIGDGGPGVVGGDPNGVPGGELGGKGIGVPTGIPHGEEIAPPPVKKPEPEPQPKAQENKVVRLASSILTGKALAKRTPDYPVIARQVRVEGSIVVEIIISPEGRVESARALNGHPLLTKAAVDAAYAWRFEPTILNGMPVRVTGVITFNFKLN
jgi:periplasmic protein TonB